MGASWAEEPRCNGRSVILRIRYSRHKDAERFLDACAARHGLLAYLGGIRVAHDPR